MTKVQILEIKERKIEKLTNKITWKNGYTFTLNEITNNHTKYIAVQLTQTKNKKMGEKEKKKKWNRKRTQDNRSSKGLPMQRKQI